MNSPLDGDGDLIGPAPDDVTQVEVVEEARNWANICDSCQTKTPYHVLNLAFWAYPTVTGRAPDLSFIPSPKPVISAFGDSLSDAGDAPLSTSSAYAAALGQSSDPVSPPYFHQTYGGANTPPGVRIGAYYFQVLAGSSGGERHFA